MVSSPVVDCLVLIYGDCNPQVTNRSQNVGAARLGMLAVSTHGLPSSLRVRGVKVVLLSPMWLPLPRIVLMVIPAFEALRALGPAGLNI